ncbi:hypothetical protein BO70DRAFT_397282 [Aspergillus heteromorphus CBS 117.55]|uniref:Uncharacterized protein n=1 Tax=Aspergillus heteromorphus CBS 117.55 TaxID=1448321 RepID=A0A317VXT0_9EURO|nr:uncharacterized protein BO70DRAFT_397282 [Aspergillus heteromorphus CBS 117.55]PWY79164.1 hypothetical protein BO70DRAFT_397282 [Aspergillus heteromorphus CBS 117.55]
MKHGLKMKGVEPSREEDLNRTGVAAGPWNAHSENKLLDSSIAASGHLNSESGYVTVAFAANSRKKCLRQERMSLLVAPTWAGQQRAREPSRRLRHLQAIAAAANLPTCHDKAAQQRVLVLKSDSIASGQNAGVESKDNCWVRHSTGFDIMLCRRALHLRVLLRETYGTVSGIIPALYDAFGGQLDWHRDRPTLLDIVVQRETAFFICRRHYEVSIVIQWSDALRNVPVRGWEVHRQTMRLPARRPRHLPL